MTLCNYSALLGSWMFISCRVVIIEEIIKSSLHFGANIFQRFEVFEGSVSIDFGIN